MRKTNKKIDWQWNNWSLSTKSNLRFKLFCIAEKSGHKFIDSDNLTEIAEWLRDKFDIVIDIEKTKGSRYYIYEIHNRKIPSFDGTMYLYRSNGARIETYEEALEMTIRIVISYLYKKLIDFDITKLIKKFKLKYGDKLKVYRERRKRGY